MSLTFKELQEANALRSSLYFQCKNWSAADWGCALAGEVGEACNFIKKLRRLGPATAEIMKKPMDEEKVLIASLVKELADVVLYADLLASFLGVDLGETVTAKFNEVSKRVDAPITLETK